MSLIPLPISKVQLENIVRDAKEYALSNGFVMGFRDLPNGSVTFSPFCLFPSKFNSFWFNYARDIQPTINMLIHKVANDREFLRQALDRTIQGDDFTRRLFEIYDQVQDEGLGQKTCLGLLRSDYMLNSNENGNVNGLKQVEINTIASSFAGLASKLHGLHSHIMRKLDAVMGNVGTCIFPASEACAKMAQGMVAAWKNYGEQKAVIAFLIEDVVYNFCDQRALEYEIMKADPHAFVLRATLADISEHGTLQNQKLFVFDKEVAVVYFRTGYMPDQYESEKDWECRLMIEKSLAIKCPAVNYHLAGTKKVQQELAAPGVLERFLDKPDDVKKIREIFAGQYSLDLNENGDKAVELALKTPHRFVMKPQREGGGNNIYGKDIVELLAKLGKTKERESYILMELINAPTSQNYIMRNGMPTELCTIISELGIYGVILGSGDEVLENYTAGHMMRSKVHGTNEGGVAAGYGVLDMPHLS